MTFTYGGDPANSNLEAVRFLLGDTVDATHVFEDEEINWALAENGNIYFAAALVADLAVAQFSGGSESNVKTKTVGALSISYADKEKADEYRKMAASLRVKGALNSVIVPYSGGISIDDKETQEADTDWDKPYFTRGMHDYPGANIKPNEFLSTSTGVSA